MTLRRDFTALALVVGLAAVSANCGGDGGGGGGGSSRIGGNVSSVTTANANARESWLARAFENVMVFARKAYAQVTGVDGVEVSAGRGSDLTDADGDFDVDAPAGDVKVKFHKDDCDAEVDLPDVASGAALTLENVAFDCASVHPDRIEETFEAIVRNKPGSPNGNLTVCVDLGSGFRSRVVKIKDATFAGGTFDDLEERDRIAVTGVREGQGAPSALDAELVTLLGPSGGDPCGGDPIPPTATPEPTSTPTPTSTPE